MATTKAVKDWVSLSDATGALADDLPADYATNKALIEDHDAFQKGKLWLGHRTSEGEVDALLIKKAEPQFVSDDVVGELLGNRTDGLLGQEADVGLEPIVEPDTEADPNAADAVQKEIAGILAPLFAWWDHKRFWEVVAKAVTREGWASRGSMRVWIAEANIPDGNLPSGLSAAEAYDLIELDAPLPDAGGRVKDVSTQRQAAVVVSDIVANGTVKKRGEVWTVDPISKLTSVKFFSEGGTPPVAPPINLGGRLPIAEMRGERIIDPSVVKLQALLNFIVTTVGRTVETAGFRERYLGNVEPELIYLTTPPTNLEVVKIDESTGSKRYGVRAPMPLGPGLARELIGLTSDVTDTAGKVTGHQYETPTVQALDPVDPAYATNAADAVTARLYKRGKQGHLALTSTAQASGIAYQQARAQFEADLKGLKGAAEGMIRDILEVVLAYAGLMSTEVAGVLDKYRVVVTLHPSAGPITAEEANLAVILRDKRAISQQTLLARVGNEDTVAEQAAIDADPLNLAAQWTAIATAMSALLNATGMTPQAAGWLLKLTPEQIQVFVTGEPPAQSEPGAAPTPLQLTA